MATAIALSVIMSSKLWGRAREISLVENNRMYFPVWSQSRQLCVFCRCLSASLNFTQPIRLERSNVFHSSRSRVHVPVIVSLLGVPFSSQVQQAFRYVTCCFFFLNVYIICVLLGCFQKTLMIVHTCGYGVTLWSGKNANNFDSFELFSALVLVQHFTFKRRYRSGTDWDPVRTKS